MKNESFLQAVSSNPALSALAASRSVLMLQGPVGPFFDRLTRWLKAQGVVEVNRVVFSGGDKWDCSATIPLVFNDDIETWPMYLQNIIRNYKVDCLVLFGQGRTHHAKAMVLASLLGVQVVVIEEGYFRPGFITMELGGVNGYSSSLDLYQWQFDPVQPEEVVAKPLHLEGFRMGWYSAVHYAFMGIFRRRYARYQHHKPISLLMHVQYFLGSWAKKCIRHWPDRLRAGLLQWRPYFLVPLQFDMDSQISIHSPFSQNTEFILEVLRSFAMHAPSDTLLVLKQHPMSRGSDGHWPFIKAVAKELHILKRIRFLSEGDNSPLVLKAMGLVTINSTMGLLALKLATPLCVMGSAVYKGFPGVYTEGLHRFWRAAPVERGANASEALRQLKNITQLPGSLYASSLEPIEWTLPS